MDPLFEKLREGKLRICSVGAGYVGALTSFVLAAFNPNVTVEVCDVNKDLINKWKSESFPFYEPLLKELYEVNLFSNLL